ncbi:MAG: hypothetical protein SFW66_05645 [Gammaproteobacteria bacterium]|nr:hypothetical protein [Gammaproteobacteria bacterium]
MGTQLDRQYFEAIVSPKTPEEMVLSLQDPRSPFYKEMMDMLIIEGMKASIVLEKLCEHWIEVARQQDSEKSERLAEILFEEHIQQQRYLEESTYKLNPSVLQNIPVNQLEHTHHILEDELKNLTETENEIRATLSDMKQTNETYKDELATIHKEQSTQLRKALDDTKLYDAQGNELILTHAEKDKIVKDITPSAKTPEIIARSHIQMNPERPHLPSGEHMAHMVSATAAIKMLGAVHQAAQKQQGIHQSEEGVDRTSFAKDYFALLKKNKHFGFAHQSTHASHDKLAAHFSKMNAHTHEIVKQEKALETVTQKISLTKEAIHRVEEQQKKHELNSEHQPPSFKR